MAEQAVMDKAAAIEFLREPHVGVLAVATHGAPAAVPLWHSCSADGSEVRILSDPGTRKVRWLRRGSLATLVVQTQAPRLRFVSVELELIDHRSATEEDVRAMASRCIEDGPALEGYLEFARANLAEDLHTFRTTRWRFADLTV